MKKITCLLFIIILIISAVPYIGNIVQGTETIYIAHPEQYDGAYRYDIQGWIYLHIKGKPYDRGYQHGYLLADEIVDHINRWSNIIHNSAKNSKKPVGIDSLEYKEISNDWWESCRSSIEKIYWDRTPEEYQNEIKGIADGAKARHGRVFGRDIDYIDILAINQMYEYMTRQDYPLKRFHPIRDLLNIGKLLKTTALSKNEKKYANNFNSIPSTYPCNAFIATGNATTNGQIVAAHDVRCGGWWYPYYVAQRWNVIIDILPEDGNRLIMASAPGYIWSDENYYQNEEGIIILETTCPQGLWNNKGYSMVIRTRRAIQYGDSLDQTIDYLMEGNDGLWTGAYLLGDTETGEIARLELALYHYGLWRTFNGFYWVANNPMDKGVRAEASGLGLKGLILKIVGVKAYGFYTFNYYDAPRDAKFRELGEKYYGDIDIEIVKYKIMSDYPLTDSDTIDVKATDSELIKSNSLWAHFGNARGMIFDVSDVENILQGAKDVPPSGWTFISGIPSDHYYNLPTNKFNIVSENNDVIWDYDISKDLEGRNSNYANLVSIDDKVFGAGLDGNVYALNASNGQEIWMQKVNNFGGETWINVDDKYVVVGWENQTYAINKNNGSVVWKNDDVRFVTSKPVFVDDKIILGSRNGDLYAINQTDGKNIWHITLGWQKAYPSIDVIRNMVFVATDNKCYAVDTTDGIIIWTFTTEGILVSPPKVVDNKVFFGSIDTNIYAINAINGELIWKNDTGWGILNTPEYSYNIVYVGSLDNRLYAFDVNNGKLLWSFSGKAAVHSAPLVYGEYVFFGCDDGRFYAVNKTNGEPAWCYAPNHIINDDIYNYITTPIVGNSVAIDGIVFFSANGKIYSLDAKTIEIKKEISEEFKLTFTQILLLIFVLLLITGLVSVYIYTTRKHKK